MKKISGIPASSGKMAGRSFRIRNSSSLSKPGIDHHPNLILEDHEIKRFQDARTIVQKRLSSHVEESPIIGAHLEILEDIADQVIDRIKQGPTDALGAVEETVKEICSLFEGIDDEYLRSRSDDIVDVGQQLRFALTCKHDNPFSLMEKNSILIADNLLVSDTLLIDKSRLAGIALRDGSKASHIAILARDHEIPLVLGIGDGIDAIPDNEIIIIDGDSGEVIIDAEEGMLSGLTGRNRSDEVDTKPAVTRDGTHVEVLANAGNLDDVIAAIARGADGIGLLRTEFIFMEGSDFPDEDQQQAIYLACARACKGKWITIRTLDIGADKQLPYSNIVAPENPLFGIRGIRFSLFNPAIFKVQLRAILRASIDGNIRVMFPMISSMEEYNAAVSLLEECKLELRNDGIAFDENLQVGMMVETPASVIMAEEFAHEAAFFSIGTNDLTQYILAVDRNNPYAENACDYFQGAILKSLSMVMNTSKNHGIDVSVCGEIASDPLASVLLLELGVRKLSVSTKQIALIKKQIRELVIKKSN